MAARKTKQDNKKNMTELGLEKWEQEIANKYPNIEFDDEKIYRDKPELRWIYDKAYISKEFNGEVAYSLEEYIVNNKAVPQYPFVIKPRVNTLGMGRGTMILKTPCDWLKYRTKSKLPNEPLIILPYYQGAHLSIDIHVVNQRIQYSTGFLAIKEFINDSFVLFASVPANDSPISYRVTRKLRKFAERVPDGFYCLEFISDKLIDAHARPALQFIELHNFWSNTRQYYSRVYRLPHNAIITASNEFYEYMKNPDYVYIYPCWEDGVALSNNPNDEYSYRYMIINGYNLLYIEQAAEEVHSLIEIKKVK